MKIQQYDEIRLKDGRIGCAVEVLGDGKDLIVDIGSSPADWETIGASSDDVVEIIPQDTRNE